MSGSASEQRPRNVRDPAFDKLEAGLPDEVRELAKKAFGLFCENPNHPSLHNKPLHDTKRGRHRAGSYSVRVSAHHRAIYVKYDDANLWYWIGSHSDYNSFTGSARK